MMKVLKVLFLLFVVFPVAFVVLGIVSLGPGLVQAGMMAQGWLGPVLVLAGVVVMVLMAGFVFRLMEIRPRV